MSQERRRILDMLAAGRIGAEEAERLLSALERAPGAPAAAEKGAARYIRVLIARQPEHAGEEETKVNIRVPLQLLRAGVKLKSLLPEEAREQMSAALREKGIDLDLNRMKAENLEEMLQNLNDLSVDIDKTNRKAKIRIFSE
ncbi:MAG TPA: hypothetical protein VG843_04055 [Rhizomicrobium sp.]|jgi:hypothetical protein|nr:hypothetical protein [Rhizomicrobium sp.]